MAYIRKIWRNVMDCTWKTNWPDTRRHLTEWWNHTGLVLGAWGYPGNYPPRDASIDPGMPASLELRYSDADWRAKSNYYALSRGKFIADTLAMANTDIGPGSLALALGSEPGISPETVWFYPTMQHVAHPETLPPLRFDPDSRWWQVHEATLKASVALGAGKFMVGCPDLVENIDILAALRDPQTLLFDMSDRAEWVSEKVAEINLAWVAAYQRVYDIIKLAAVGTRKDRQGAV